MRMTPADIPLKPTVCIILSDSSWLDIDAERLRQADASFICVNDTGRYLDWPEFWFTCDDNQVRKTIPLLPESMKRIVARYPAQKPIDTGRVDYLLDREAWNEDWKPEVVRGYNSGMAAHEMALKHPGVERIFLFGCGLADEWTTWHPPSVDRGPAHLKAYAIPCRKYWMTLPPNPKTLKQVFMGGADSHGPAGRPMTYNVNLSSALGRYPRVSWEYAAAMLSV